MDSTPPLRQRINEMLMESLYWPLEQMLAFQRSQLGQLLHHSRTHVPFHEEGLAPVFRSNGNIDWSRWQEIPIVKRHHLIEQRDSKQNGQQCLCGIGSKDYPSYKWNDCSE